MRNSLIKYCLILMFIIIGCDAPRENPIDPENPDNVFVSLSGVVRTISVPNQPIPEVMVFWANEKILVETDGNGIFQIDDLAADNGYLFFDKEGYGRDSLLIEWAGRKNVNITQQLNSNPELVNGTITSSVENRFPNVQSYKLIIETQITDDENDVDSVFIFNEELGVNLNLLNISITRFQNEFTPQQFNIPSVDEVIGKEFTVVAKDVNEKTFNIAELTVKRIIKELIEAISPANNEVIPDTLRLNWRRFSPGYSLTYALRIFTNTIDPDLIWGTDDISSDEIFYEVTSSIEPGEYFWVVWVIDEFGNRARSRPASFIIE